MGAPPPSSGGVYARIQILTDEEAPKYDPRNDKTERFWAKVNGVLAGYGKTTPLVLTPYFSDDGYQVGYEARLGKRGVGGDAYKDLRAALTDLLSSKKLNKPVDEWTRVSYGYEEGGGPPKSLLQMFPPPPQPFGSGPAKVKDKPSKGRAKNARSKSAAKKKG